MSVEYHLVCLDCMDSINLGNAVNTRYEKQEQESYSFDEITRRCAESNTDRGWVAYNKGCEVLAHFLMLHRTHELRVLPDNVPDVISIPFPVEDRDDDYNYDDFLSRPVHKPMSDVDRACVSESVVKKIEKYFLEQNKEE